MQPAALLQILVTANTAQATAALARTDTQLKKTAVTAQGASTSMGAKIAKGAKYGALGVAALGAVSVKAAMDFESSFASVRKTVDTSEKGFARLEKGLRGLAREIPVSVNELNELAGQAGALGIKAKDIVKFTKTAAELGITTDLSAEAAANALARLSNIMGTSSKDFRRLGSTLVDLGNKGASTEAEIAEIALRVAASGRAAGLSEGEVLAYSSALAGIGIPAEAAGSSISKAFDTMGSAVISGGEKLRGFAEVAGMSVGSFRRLFEQDAARAMQVFTQGLEGVRKAGGDQVAVLKDLELGDLRVLRAMRGLGAAGPVLTKALRDQGIAWKDGSALADEARKRYATLESQWKVLKNQANDLAISFGQKLIPHLKKVVGILTDDKLSGSEKFTKIMDMAGKAIEKGVPIVAQAAAAAAPKVAWAFVKGFLAAGAWGRLLIAGWLLHKMGGLGAFGSLGGKAGTRFGKGFGAAAGVFIAADIINQLEGPMGNVPDVFAGRFREGIEELSAAQRRNAGVQDKWINALKVARREGLITGDVFKELAAKFGRSGERSTQNFIDGLRPLARRAKGVLQPVDPAINGILKNLPSKGRRHGDDLVDDFVGSLRPLPKRSRDALSPLPEKAVQPFAALNRAAGRALEALRDGVNTTLRGFGSREFVNFAINLAQFTSTNLVPNQANRQRGGPIFGGAPTGDSIPAMLERGEYVLNRKAVATIGAQQLDAINFGAAPRFARGGPILSGPEPLRSMGQAGIDKTWQAATKFLEAHRPTGLGAYTGPPANFSQLGDNRWVDSHTMAVGAYMAKKFGVSITDGWRPQNAGYGAPNSSHKRGTPANPGAIDFAPSSRAFQSYAGKHIAGLTENLYNDPYSTGPHNHLAFFAKGGMVPGFAGGGAINDPVMTRTLHGQPVAGSLRKIRRMWNAASPYFGRAGADLPHTKFAELPQNLWGQVNAFEDDSRMVTLDPGLTKALRKGSNYAEALLLHEWAHYHQNYGRTNKRWEREGGADAFAKLAAPGVTKAAGIRYNEPPFFSYPGLLARVEREKSRKWIMHGQFAKAGVNFQQGGLVGMASGGKVNLDALVGGSRGWDVNERATLAHVAGQKSPGLMAAISMMEAPNNLGGSKANGPPDGRGLWQIEWPTWAGTMAGKGLTDAYNSWQNARMAKVVQDEQGLGAWVVYNDNNYGAKGSVMGALAGRMRDVISGGSSTPAAPKPPTTTAGGVGPPAGTPGGTTAGAWGGTYEAGPAPSEIQFGPMPSNIVGCMMEINRLRGRLADLKIRREKAQKAKAPASVIAQFSTAITKVKARLGAVIQRRNDLLKAQKSAIRSKIARVGQLPAWEAAVNNYLAPEGTLAVAQEHIDRLLQLEPLEFGDENAFKLYTNKESVAYGLYLSDQMGFRSTLLGGESAAGQRLNTTVNPAISFIEAALRDKRYKGQWPALQKALKPWKTARTGLNTLVGDWDSNLVPLQGAGSTRAWMAAAPELGVLGGDILNTQITMRDLGLRKWEAPFTDSGVGGDSGAGDDGRLQAINDTLSQMLESAQRIILTHDLQSPVAADFAGYYAQGGVIPGPIGKPFAAVVHGGEEVLTPAQRRGGPIVVQLIVEDGAVDINKIRAVASSEIQVELRKVARGIQTSSPSSVGRQTAVG